MQTFKSAQAQVIADSISPEGIRLTTIHARYPRMIHSEFMTHRVFSRNGRSSRAVPVLTLLDEAPYMPHFMRNGRGMVAHEEMSDHDREQAEEVWLRMIEHCQRGVHRLQKLGVHKQWANRPLEWFGYIDVLMSSTDWKNFHHLRSEAGAQPEIQHLSELVQQIRDSSTPKPITHGEWHLPYIRQEDWEPFHDHLFGADYKGGYGPNEVEWMDEVARKVSTARCARLTYKPFDGNGSIEAEIARHDLLMVSQPVHASPAEHIATPDELTPGYEGPYGEWRVDRWKHPEEHGNYRGWRQYRKQVPTEWIPG